MQINPTVSVVIPTKNVAKSIEACLNSVHNQNFRSIEIIVVDNYSNDNTLQIVKKFTKKVFLKGPERNTQRNFGASKALGKYIMWIDSDMMLERNVIKECVSILDKNADIAALIIPERSIGKGFWARCKTLEKQCYIGDERIEGIRFMRKRIFKNIGGFSSNLISGEDWDITKRVRQNGYKISRIKSFIIHDEGELTLMADLRKKYYYATRSLPYIERHISRPSDILLFIFRPSYIKNWKLLASHPVYTCGMIFMKFAEMTVGFVGLVATMLTTYIPE